MHVQVSWFNLGPAPDSLLVGQVVGCSVASSLTVFLLVSEVHTHTAPLRAPGVADRRVAVVSWSLFVMVEGRSTYR